MPPSDYRITPQEISNVLDQVKSNPTTMDTFYKRLEVMDVWIMLLIKSGKIDEVAKLAPPDTIPKIFELKRTGKNNVAYQKLDTLYLELEKIGIPQVAEDVISPSKAKKPVDPLSEENADKKVTDVPYRETAGKSVEKPSITKSIKEVTVDCNITEGEISPYLFGIVLGPGCDKEEMVLLKDAGFKLLLVLLPIGEGETDPYTMDDLKKDMEIILNVGASPLFTIAPNAIPRDEKRYFNQLKTIVSFINDEWAKKYPKKEWIFRFGNEPENPFFWKDTQEDFFKMYATWASVIKKINPKFIVGGPGLATGCTLEGATVNCSKLNTWTTNFLTYMEKENVPLDFFSFHAYSPHIYMWFNQQTKALYSELAKHPKLSPLFGIPRLANDEWNITGGKPWSGVYNHVFDQAWTAAHHMCALISMINEGLWLSCKHGGVCRIKRNIQQDIAGRGIPHQPRGIPPLREVLPNQALPPQQEEPDKDMGDFLMITEDGLPKPVYYAFKGINQLANQIKLKLIGNDGINFSAIAVKSKDNNKIIVMLANYDSSKCQMLIKRHPYDPVDEYKKILKKLSVTKFDIFDGYKLLLRNLPWQQKDKIILKRYEVSDEHNLNEVENTTLSITESKIELLHDIILPGIQIITIEKQG